MTTRYPFALIKEKLAARRGRALDFAIGQHRIPLPGAIASWITAHAGLAMQPAGAVDMSAFAAAAADLLRREYAVEINPDRILPAPGGRAAMSAFIACALEPGQSVFVTEPGYPAFMRLAAHRHARIQTLELDPDRGFAPDLEAGSGGEAPPPRVIALNYPNNPTGATLSAQMVAGLAGLGDGATILFNDATYAPLVYEQLPTSLLHPDILGDSTLEAVELHSFSKLFPIGPLAVSFLVGSEATMRSVSTYSEFAWSPLSLLQLQATTKCLQDSGRLHELREFFPRQLGELRQTLIELGFEPYPAPAGVYVLCNTPARIGGQGIESAAQAAALLMDDFDVAVVPWDTPRRSYLRFSSLFRAEDLQRLAELREKLQLS